jgi:outer membrane protein insertion porin family
MRLAPAVLAALLLCLLPAAGAWAATAVRIGEIRVESEGVVVDPSSVTPFISLKKGDLYSASAAARDVKSLEQSGRFSYVGVRLDEFAGGVDVVFVVRSKPRIRKLEISGADEIGNKKVKELLELKAGDLVDESIMAFKALKVKEHYQKKHFPKSSLAWDIKEDRASGSADVHVKVSEGRRASIKAIEFPGRKSVEAKPLAKAMKQKKWNIFWWLTGSGTYKPDELEADVEAVRKIYRDHGFLDVKVGEPAVKYVSPTKIEISMPIEEGTQYRFGRIDLSGVTTFPGTNVAAVITNRTGDVASMAAIERSAQAINDYYGSRGYISSRAVPALVPDVGQGKVDVEYAVKEGPLVRVRDVHIRGNTITKDKVIRREVLVYPGEVFNEVKVRTSERRLRNLGYFKYVNSVPEPTDQPDKSDLAFEVEEDRTGQFTVGVGYSSIDELITYAELQQGNFDIGKWPPTGGGQKLRIRGQLGTARTDAEVAFTEPWFLDRKLALGVNLFARDLRYLSNDYDQENVGMKLSLGKALGAFNRLNIIYGLEEYNITDVDEDASATIKAEEGRRTKSSLTLQLVHDTRNSPFLPTQGMKASIEGSVAGGPLGADTDIYGFEGDVSKYWPVWFEHVVNLRGWIAGVEEYGDSENVPIFDRLFLGGARTLRGFQYRDVGPKDETGEPIGGKSAWYLTLEYTVPIVEKLRFATFYDMGMVYEPPYEFEWSDYNSDWGIGLRVDIPGFPLRFDYAWPLEADEFNDRSSGRFQFTIGYGF